MRTARLEAFASKSTVRVHPRFVCDIGATTRRKISDQMGGVYGKAARGTFERSC
jgi:hypothetical protein